MAKFLVTVYGRIEVTAEEQIPEDLPCLTFAELLDWRWREYGSKRRGYDVGFLRQRLLPTRPLGNLALAEVTPARCGSNARRARQPEELG